MPPDQRIRLDVQRASVALLIPRRRRCALRSAVGLFGIFLVRFVHVLVAVADLLRRAVRRLQRNHIDLILSSVLHHVHPVGNVLGEPAAIRMDRPPLPVRIVHVLILVDHRVKAVVDVTVVGEVVMRLLDEKRVFGRDDATVEHAVADGSVHEALLVTQNASLVDVTRVDLSFALLSVLGVVNLKSANALDIPAPSEVKLQLPRDYR